MVSKGILERILVCDFCRKEINRAYYESKDKKIACPACFNSKWKVKELNPDSTVGISRLTDILVAKKLGIELTSNKSGKFANVTDMFDTKMGRIKVAGSSLHIKDRNHPYHNFLLTKSHVEKIDTYIFIGYDVDRKHIIRVYIVPVDFIKKHIYQHKKNNDRKYLKLSIPMTSINRGKDMEIFKQDQKEWDDLFIRLST
jgi:hypothetical protein